MDYRKPHIPIFIITHNRLQILKRCVDSYEKTISTPIRIIFYNVASTYKPTLDYMSLKEKEGCVVYNSSVNNHKLVINAIRDYLQKNPQCGYYVLTDPDIELDNVKHDILEFYINILNKTKVKSVGPMLRIDDIPDYYPRKQNVIDGHGRQFWSKPVNYITYKNSEYGFIHCATDTTFQLSSRNNIPSNFPNGNAIRCLSPYSARHLDWYLDPTNLSPCQKYYADGCSSTSHWANPRWNGTYHGKKINLL